ncbi:MAG: hypothetical protein ACI8XB_001768 [Patiriisocius sp.]
MQKKEDSPNETVLVVDLKLKEVHENGVLKTFYTYNNENRIDTLRTYVFSPDNPSIITYKYIVDSLTIKFFSTSSFLSSQNTFSRATNDIVRFDRQEFVGDMEISHSLYYFNGNSCGIELVETYDVENIQTGETELEYSETTCNLTFSEQNESGLVIRTGEIIRDNQNLSEKSAINTWTYPNSIGNITKNSRWNANGEINSSFSYESVFTYNSDSYPTNEIRTYVNGTVLDLEYFYY